MPTLFSSSDKPLSKTLPSQKKIKINNSSMGPLTTFAVNPTGVRFETQEDSERVVLFLRQHIIVNLPWILLTLFLIFIPIFFVPVLFRLQIPIAIPWGYYFIGVIFWYLATFGFALSSFMSWFFNIYIVTNERLVDIDFFYLLYKDFKEAELNKIQDLSYSCSGIIATICNYGNVHVETAGETPNITFEMIPYPEKVVETIRTLTGEGENSV